MARISFPINSFNHFKNCLPDILEEEISRTNIRLKLSNGSQTNEERQLYQEELDRLSALKYISQLRKGKLTKEEFNQKVELAAL
ncbi:hypothetical protein [Mucilaginibacter jinjuensis]|uniref:SHOCT domain-containing protein n=1 Tax=Mucilaginibacter jinjuensis TaxID=1176721 RepID=A0ABY7TBE9_9SPHI|nr:hypothetical protein [Mucilaginibacter jinjuensis]WCT13528.1 hypothetical protein PQO05_06210 [Mucilaginibacter jinjuensis]